MKKGQLDIEMMTPHETCCRCHKVIDGQRESYYISNIGGYMCQYCGDKRLELVIDINSPYDHIEPGVFAKYDVRINYGYEVYWMLKER